MEHRRRAVLHDRPLFLQAVAGGFIVASNDQRRANKASQISNIL
jgi:hypothetical protein